jgi:uncharacterized lipoprotein YddW (UPF0748 family)
MTLEEFCGVLRDQVTAEIYVDRRFADDKVVLSLQSDKIPLKVPMSLVEHITGLKWRMVDDLFFLTRSLEGEAVASWYERYAEAKKAHEAGVLEKRTKEWLAVAMPFPPRFDPPWMLTPFQREEMAFQQALSVFAMTPPQLVWLDHALRLQGYQTLNDELPVDRLLRESPVLPVVLKAGMVIRSGGREYLIEMPLSEMPGKEAEKEKSEVPQTLPKDATPAPAEHSEEEVKTSNVAGELKGIWVSGGNYDKLTSLLRKAKDKGFTDLYLPVLNAGHTLYPSSKLPQEPKYRGKDPLGEAVRVADSLGIRVHAVLQVTLWGDDKHPVPSPASSPLVQDRNLLGRTFSEQEKWQRAELAKLDEEVASSDSDEKKVYLCPASSQVARLVRQVVEEVAGRYGIAGICLDGLDYPRSTPFKIANTDLTPPFGYTLEVRKEMIRANQIDPVDVDPLAARTEKDMECVRLWEQFRRGRLTGLLTEVAVAFRTVKPKGIFSVTLDLESPDQSPARWAKVQGLDVLIPSLQIPKLGEEVSLEAVSSLQKVVGKSGFVVPAVRSVDQESADLSALVSSLTVRIKDSGLGGFVIVGDVEAVSSVLDVASF